MTRSEERHGSSSIERGSGYQQPPPPNQDGQIQRGNGVGGARRGPGNKTNPTPQQGRARYSGAAVRVVGVAQGKRKNQEQNRMDRLTGTAQDAVSKEVVTLVGDRTGPTAEADVRNGQW